ncbi:acyl-CoA dehydrogenase family protein [Bordetella pseudohinzii]|uniref:Acyl-CoA dehydrogenase n=1 Tax=Bordetella pseudohinzii TaxID=1331258 RepID=A0A0J6BRT4_9BORD|nr:acyl-CoA dehydrogenase family protein [Bordetella pseudohinzii]ANY16051.1 acyl-CoA dehydrogenase [Bordetella pseudohinzii]KMM24554.1 acyl-CoA dehydrogenase [Bordetella pseudohinzii]KXA76605.1 acyl-CoA dehydrogenase [Bordetella pseudohinzii]KXA76934.1 acyl-CoA dehydrogenase [Bordetella pseudohinzii]CUJ09695.1 Acyl-CoA dehydrogenase%2C short-chain specific [Bordetella pseudohinzii]
MDLELTEEQRAFAQAARDYAQGELAPHAARWDAEGIFPREAFARAGELGFCAIYASEAIGGLGLPRLDATLVFEEMAAVDPSTTAFLTIHNMATWMVGQWGSAEVREQWGPLLASGEKLASYCLTEPNAGSDAGSLATRAERDGGDFLISGAKAFISGGGDTDLLVVMARTGGAGPSGVSAFAVPADAPGITYGRKEEKMGWNSQSTRPISFEHVRVPARNMLGAEGEGFKIAMKGLDGGRINIGTCSVGAAQGALDAARRYMDERRQFNRKLSEFQALQFKLADMATHLVAARQMVRLAACKLDSGSADAGTYCAMAKRFATDMGFQICLDAQQIHGGYGYLRDYPLERLVRDTRVHQILEGTNEIMRVIVARQLLEKGADIR